jgi:hypothetical protein
VKYVVVQGCPCPAPFAPFLEATLGASGSTLNSCYRGADAEALLHKFGKRSQTELFRAWTERLPGANPANPPGESTHELRNDGKAYSGPARGKLKWWQCGIDVNDSDVQRFIAAAKKRGWVVSQTYPLSKTEFHHVNFRKPPLRERVRGRIGGALRAARV